MLSTCLIGHNDLSTPRSKLVCPHASCLSFLVWYRSTTSPRYSIGILCFLGELPNITFGMALLFLVARFLPFVINDSFCTTCPTPAASHPSPSTRAAPTRYHQGRGASCVWGLRTCSPYMATAGNCYRHAVSRISVPSQKMACRQSLLYWMMGIAPPC